MSVEDLRKIGIFCANSKENPNKFYINGLGDLYLNEPVDYGDIYRQIYQKGLEDGVAQKKKNDDIPESLTLNKFKINAPNEWDPDEIVLEINDCDYESTRISFDDLKKLYEYIGKILYRADANE
jgi:hypothetical protein